MLSITLCIIFIIFIIPSIPTESTTEKKLVTPPSTQTSQLSFAAFADTHIGIGYEYPKYRKASYLDKIGADLTTDTNRLDFAIHLGDIINHNVAQIHGNGLPPLVNQYRNNLKKYLIANINIPFHCVIGNHDLNDYTLNKHNPHNLTLSLTDELSMNSPLYAMMRDGLLFLIVPELGFVQWTHPIEYIWIEHMVNQYPNTTTIILCHQAIEDTTCADEPGPYRGKQDEDWWASLFQNNPQIKMWIHGHNHMLSWYCSNQSSGKTHPIQQFGHTIAFSAPYSQLDWGGYHEEDRIVIYNISSHTIQTATWEHNLFGGKWIPTYQNTWELPTTYDPDATDWYLFTMFLQDNETQKTPMKLISPNITLQLIGTPSIEHFYDSELQSPSGRPAEKILGFGNDQSDQVKWTNPGMQIQGPHILTFPEKYPHTNPHEDGRSGPLFHSFPMGTICSAIPYQNYTITLTARSKSGTGHILLNMNCTDWSTQSQYSTLPNSHKTIINQSLTDSYQTVYGYYTVPQNQNAWFLQGTLHFLNSTQYDVSKFSIQRTKESVHTENFHLQLSGHWYNHSGILHPNELHSFPLNPTDLGTPDGIINLTAKIKGNHNGMIHILYEEPLLLTRNAQFTITNYSQGRFNLTLTKTLTRTSSSPSPKQLLISYLYSIKNNTNKNPLYQFLCFLNQLKTIIQHPYTALFKILPYSTSNLYHQIHITVDDNSAQKHISPNRNFWFTTNLPDINNRTLTINIP